MIINGASSDFLYWLKCSIKVPSEGITTLQESLFSHISFMWYELVFCSFKWKTRRQWKTWWDMFTNFVLKEWKQFSKNKDHHYFLVLFLFHNADRFLLQDNTILLRLGSLKNNLFFTIWVMFWSISKIFFSFFRIQNIKTNF